MNRVATVALRLAIAIVIALALLGAWLQVTGQGGFAEGARQLFLFMDIGLGVWLVLLVVGAVRGWGIRAVVTSAVLGVALNLLTVAVVGFVQSGSAPWEFLGWALQSGVAFLVGAVIATVAVKPRARIRPTS